MNLLNTGLGRLRIIAFLEGLSFLVLMGIAMPMKYIWEYEHATQDVGMAHGLLFIAYVIAIFILRKKMNWSWPMMGMLFLASILPFGTFVAEYKVFKKILEY